MTPQQLAIVALAIAWVEGESLLAIREDAKAMRLYLDSAQEFADDLADADGAA